VRVKGAGLRAIHPSRYVVRSERSRQEALLDAAWTAPELFQSGVVRAHAFPLRPVDKNRWDALLTVRFPIELGDDPGVAAERDFGSVLFAGSRIAHRFNRRVTVRPLGETGQRAPVFTFVERVTLAPGQYKLETVMSAPKGGAPHSAVATIEIPEVPRGKLFLTGPALWRPAGDDLVVYGDGTAQADADRRGDAGSFVPLLVQQLDRAADLAFLSDACLVGSGRGLRGVESGAAVVERRLSAGSRQLPGTFSGVPLDLSDGGRVRCQSLIDVAPADILAVGDYVFELSLDGDGAPVVKPRSTRFAVDVSAAPGVN